MRLQNYINKTVSKTVVLLTMLFAVSLCNGQYDEATSVPEDLKVGFDLITDKQCKEWLAILAGPTFSGRGSGQVGYTKAAHWVSGKVAEFGLEPAGVGGSYFQMLPMTRKMADLSQSKIEGPNGLKIEGADHLGFQRFTEQPQAAGAIAFVTIKGTSPQLDPNVSLRDKVVIFTSGDESDFRAQILIARQQPAAVIRIAEGKPTNPSSVGSGRRARSMGIWCSISSDAAEELVASLGVDADWIKKPTENGVVVNEVDAKLTVTVRVREEKLVLPNVIAWLEGSDPELKDEYIVLGAHLDHLGTRNGKVYPGADDNGSGSTAILNVALAMAKNPVKPKRSVMFIWFAAEEIGLVGSRYYCDNPTRPLDKVVCMFNCDMVGRNEETANESASENENTIHLVGSKRGGTKLHDIIMDANRHVKFEFEYDQEGVFGRSDQANFWKKGIPVAFLFGGFHPDYHQPGDELEKINYHKITSAARLFYLSIYGAAEHGPFKMKKED